jgi:hypothetical protein
VILRPVAMLRCAVSGSEPRSHRAELLALIESQAGMFEKLTAPVVELNKSWAAARATPHSYPRWMGLAVAPTRAARRPSARPPRKQPGADGSGLFQTSNRDEIVNHIPHTCGGCGSDLAGTAALGVVRRQVHDTPTLTPLVVEHRLHHRRRCGCGGDDDRYRAGRGERDRGVRAEPARARGSLSTPKPLWLVDQRPGRDRHRRRPGLAGLPAGSTSNTHSVPQADRRLDHPANCAIPPPLTAGPGWASPPTPSCAWPVTGPSTSAVPGNGPGHPGG